MKAVPTPIAAMEPIVISPEFVERFAELNRRERALKAMQPVDAAGWRALADMTTEMIERADALWEEIGAAYSIDVKRTKFVFDAGTGTIKLRGKG